MSALERIRAGLGDLVFRELEPRDGMATIELDRDALADAMRRLRERCDFDANTFVTAVDHFPLEPRFRVVWQFLSVRHNDRVRVQCRVNEDDAVVPTITHLWPGAAFSEREVWDLFGIRFDGHANLRRLMMPEGYDHHPLRKDFPHQGIEPDRLYREWDKNRRVQDESPA